MTSPSSMRAFTALAVALTVCGAAGGVRAQTEPASDDAERLYREGSEALQRGELDVACPKLAESQRLEPAAGAALALGLCREREGRLASAVAAYVAAARLARSRGDEERAAAAETRTAELRPRVPAVAMTPTEGLRADGAFDVVIDGVVVASGANGPLRIDVDAGEHWIEARSGSRTSRRVRFEVREGAVASVALEPVASAPPATPAPTPPLLPAAPPPPRAEAGWSSTRIVGVATLGVGALGLAAGTVFAAVGASDASTLDELGYDGQRGTCRAALASCKSSYDGASTAADASTALWIAGGALVGLGITLFAIGGDEASGADAALRVGPAGLDLAGRL